MELGLGRETGLWRAKGNCPWRHSGAEWIHLPLQDRDFAGEVQASVRKFSPVLSYRPLGRTVHPKLLPAPTSVHCEQRRALQATPRNWRRETCNLDSHFFTTSFPICAPTSDSRQTRETYPFGIRPYRTFPPAISPFTRRPSTLDLEPSSSSRRQNDFRIPTGLRSRRMTTGSMPISLDQL